MCISRDEDFVRRSSSSSRKHRLTVTRACRKMRECSAEMVDNKMSGDGRTMTKRYVKMLRVNLEWITPKEIL